MITVYHLTSSRSERVVWLLEELALDYQLERFPREANGAARPYAPPAGGAVVTTRPSFTGSVAPGLDDVRTVPSLPSRR